MSRISTIERLPQGVRTQIDQRLIDNGFGDYIAIANELNAQGYHKISKSGLHRYGAELKRRVQAARAHAQLEAAGIDTRVVAEITGESTLVVVIDRRNGRARLISLPANSASVITHIKQMHKERKAA